MLPTNPDILLSIINTKLRDEYSSFDDLIDSLDEDKQRIEHILNSSGYFYDQKTNQFKLKDR
jgi:hypothetical protein